MLRRGACARKWWALNGMMVVVGEWDEGILLASEFRSQGNACVSPSTIPHEYSRAVVLDDTDIAADADLDDADADTDSESDNADNSNVLVAADAQTTLLLPLRPAPPPSSRPADAPSSAR